VTGAGCADLADLARRALRPEGVVAFGVLEESTALIPPPVGDAGAFPGSFVDGDRGEPLRDEPVVATSLRECEHPEVVS